MKKVLYLLVVLTIGLFTILTSCQRNNSKELYGETTTECDSLMKTLSLYDKYELKVQLSIIPKKYSILDHPLYYDQCGQKCVEGFSYGANDSERPTRTCMDTCELFSEANHYKLAYGYYAEKGPYYLLPALILKTTRHNERVFCMHRSLVFYPGEEPMDVMVQYEEDKTSHPAHKVRSGDNGCVYPNVETDLPNQGNRP